MTPATSNSSAKGGALLFSFEDTELGSSYGGLIATNMIATQTNAYIQNGVGSGRTTVTATAGSINVNATDSSINNAISVLNVTEVHANNESDIVALLNQLFTTSYNFTSASGTQLVIAGDEVLDDSTGTPQIYTYKGPTLLVDLSAATQNYANNHANWTPLLAGAPTVAALTAPFANFNLTASNAKAVGLVFVMNEVQALTTATITSASVTANGTGGGINVAATESAAIAAFVENSISSSGGSQGVVSPTAGGSMAASGSLVTNLVDASATADIDRANFTSTPADSSAWTNSQWLTPGETVQIANGNDGQAYGAVTPGDVVGSAGTVIINPGDVIQDGSTFYRYIGFLPISANLSTTANFNTLYNSSPAAFAKVAGATGTVYQYNGPAGSVDLYNTDYTGANWTALTPTQVTPVVSAGTGGITVNAANAAQLDAQALVATATNGGGTQASYGLVLAFNSLGYDPELFLFNAIDALLGSNYLSNPNPSNATAFIHDTTITADGGDLTVLARSQEQVNATNSNAADTTASALFDATGEAYGGSIASNKVDGSAYAYIDESDLSSGAYSFSIGGSLSVQADDTAGIFSNVKLVSSSTVTNDGGAGILQAEFNALTPATWSTTPNSDTVHPGDTATSVIRALANGDTVKLGNGSDGAASYDAVSSGTATNGSTLPEIAGQAAPNTTIKNGDVVQNGSGGPLYRYLGPDATFNLSQLPDNAHLATDPMPDFTDQSKWAPIGGTPGNVYVYMGPGGSVNLATTDYTDLNFWKPFIVTQLVPQGLNVTNSDSAAAGFIFVLNDVRSDTKAYVTHAGITAGVRAAIVALDQATITATNDSTVINTGGSALGAGTENSYSGVVATNLVQSASTAFLQSSPLTVNGSDLGANGNNPAVAAVTIYASNNATITATNSANTASGGNGDGIVLAFNTLGYQSANFLQNALTTLLGSPDFSQTAGGDVSAYVTNSALNATAGSISVEAVEQATISANTSNATTSLASGFINENSSAMGGLLASNMINASANAYIDSASSTQTIKAGGGALSIIAKDDARITANNNLQVASTSISTPQGLLLSYLGNILNNYQFTSSSGTQTVGSGDLVYVGSDTVTPTWNITDGTQTVHSGDTILAVNGEVYRYDGPTSSSVNLATTNFATAPFFNPNIYTYNVKPTYVASFVAIQSDHTVVLSTNDTVLSGDGKIYKYTGAGGSFDFSDTSFLTTAAFQVVNVLNLGTQDYSSSSWKALNYSGVANAIPGFNLSKSNATADGAIFVLNDVHSTVAATASSGALSAAGALTIDAENNAIINAINSSTITASGASPFTPDGSATGFNVTIASNYVLGSTIASATGSSLTTTAGGNINITALANASIDAEMDATTTANSSTIGVVLAFNTIGINEPVAGFLEGTVDALFGTDLASENPYTVEAYTTDSSINAAGGVNVTANDTSDIIANISNVSLAVPQLTSIASTPGIAVGATIALNHIATSIQAYVDQTGSADSVSAGVGDINIESSDSATVFSTVVTPVVKIGVSFTQSGASSSIGVSIARNIIESNVSSYDGGRVIGGTDANPIYDNGLALTAHNGNINVTSGDTAVIDATSASAAIALSVTPSAAGGFAGGGAVAINTILGSVIANTQGVALGATTVATNTGNVVVSATDHRQITATVAAVSAQASLGGAAAIGAAVALNLIGWRGTVADETEDSHNPIVVQGNVKGGSITAGAAVSITAASTSLINATTVAGSVAIGISLTGGSNSGKQEKNGQEGNVAEGEGGSPTSAEEEGKGATDDAEGGKTATDEGQADGAKVEEGADNAGAAETNQAEEGGKEAGEAGNTAAKETGSKTGTATSIAKGVGQGGGLLVGLGGVVSSSQAGGAAAPDYTTPASPSTTDVVTLTAGQSVQLDIGYATANYAVGNGSANTTVNQGEVVNDDGTLYRYLGASPLTGVDFSSSTSAPDFTSKTNGSPDWAQIGGTGGDTYQYIGAGGHTDLNNQNYTDASLWSDITGGSSSGGGGTSSLPAGVATATVGAGLGFLTGGSSPTPTPKTDKGPTDPTGATNPDKPATPTTPEKSPEGQSGSAGAAGKNLPSGGSSKSLSGAGVYTENKIAADVTASVSNTTSITTGAGGSNGLSVLASDTAHINSIDGAAAVSANFSDSQGTSVSIGISIARNTIQDTVAASVVNAGTITAPNAPITIEATQGAVINATSVAAALDVTGASTTGLGVAGGASLADNLIGTNTTATLSGTTVGASGANHAVGALTVSATDSSTINADVIAASASLAFAGEGSTAVGIGASLAHNRIGDGTDTGRGAVTASISSSTIYSGAIEVLATSSQSVTATVEAASVAVSGGGESGAGSFRRRRIRIQRNRSRG